MKATKIISLLIALAIAFNLSGCSGAKRGEKTENNIPPEDNRTLIVELGAIDVEGLVCFDAIIIKKSNSVFISNSLTKALNDYKGQDVWFRLLANFEDFPDYAEAGREYNDVLAEELQYVEQIGVMNIEKADATTNSLGFYKEQVYCMEATADMIEKLLARKCAQLTLNTPKREGSYSDKIADTTSYRLERINNSDAIEIVAVTAYDYACLYAVNQKSANGNCNYGYNKDLEKFENITYAECDALLEQTVVDILKRNNILEKRVVSDDLPQIGFGEEVYPHAAELEYIPVGFNAVLTKAEILKLAEDPEIKVIYLAPQK